MFHTEDSPAEPVAEGDHDPVGRHPVEDMEEEEDEGADGTDDTDDGIEGAEEEEDEEEYTPHFEGAMDPLGFVQGVAPQGIELYQQFERLEYEILAERKRKALQDSRSCDQPAKKKAKNDEMLGVTLEEIEEMMSFGHRRRKRVTKKRGRAKGSRNKLSPEVSMRIADATLHYASGNYDEAIPILEEAVRLAPNLPDGYNLLGLIYDAMSDRKRALDFHMIAAHLSPKDISLWKKLIGWSIEQKNFGQVRYCLSKAITAEPKDVGLRFDLALLYVELGEYQKAAESYHQIVDLYPANCDARMMAAKMYQKCGLLDKAIGILENSFNDRSVEADQSYLIALYMENCSYENAIQLIEKAWLAFNSPNEIPFYLKARKAICYAHLGNMGVAEVFLQDLQNEHIEENGDLVNEVASAFMILGYFNLALKLYLMMDKIDGTNKAILHLKIAQCYASLSERRKAIPFYYKSLSIVEDNIDARITLSSLLVEEGKEDEAIVLLSPLKSSGALSNFTSTSSKPWWLSEKVKIQLAKLYHLKGRLEDFVDTIFPSVKKTLFVESMNQKRQWRTRKKLSKSVLFERAKLLEDHPLDSVFCGFKPVLTASELAKANRAKKSLEKLAALREERKVAALSAGMDWQYEESDDDAPQKVIEEPPLPGLLRDKEGHQLLLDLCKTLASLHRYAELLEIINYATKLPIDMISAEKKEELQSLGAQIAYKTPDPKHAYDYARNMVLQHPYNTSAWNSYYKLILRFQNRFGKHFKFLHHMRVKHSDCVPPMIINGNQCTMQSMHQAAAEEYLLAYKLQPDNPLINLCVGTALINLALGFRLQNKHQCVIQAFAFLYNYLRICDNSQEAFYNIARACHHVGLVTLAALYYEKVIAIQVKDYPFPRLPNEVLSAPYQKPGSCNLRMEAAFNLHLIYKQSGAVDLARQILKDYCTP